MESINNIEKKTGNALRETYEPKDFIIDASNTALYLVLDNFEGISKITLSTKEAVKNAFTKGNLKEKLRKVPTSLVTLPFMTIEGVIETLYGSTYNFGKNLGNTITNPFKDKRISIKGTFKDNDKTPKMRLASLF